MDGIERYWDVAQCLGDVVEILLEGYFFCRFLRPFLKRKCAAVGAGLAYFVGMFFLWQLPFEVRWPDILGTAAAFGVMYLLDRRNAAQKIFLSVTMCLLIWLEYGFALVPCNLFIRYVLNTPYVQERELLQFFGYLLVLVVLHCILQGILLHWMVGLFHRAYPRKSENVTIKELGLLFSALLTVFAGRFVLSFTSEVYFEDTGNYVWNVHGEFNWMKTLYQIFSFSAVFFTIVVYQKIREGQQKEKENAVLAEQAGRLYAHIREVEALYAELRGLRHDMGNHVAVMESLFLENEPEELKRYFRKLKEEFLRAENMAGGGIRSGNPVTDIILAQKKHCAQEQGIDFSCDFHYPQKTNLDVFDISVILSNLLDNALEAAVCPSCSYVRVRAWRRKNIFMIEVENGFSGRLVLDEESKLPQSTKQDGKNHGFGLVNIRRVAQKYFGDVEIVQEGECVHAGVMLTLECVQE